MSTNYNKELNDLILEANSKGFIFKDGQFINKKYKESDYTIILELYYRYEMDCEDYGHFWFGRKFIELTDIDEAILHIKNEEDFSKFLEDNQYIPDIIFDKIDQSCWEFSDDYDRKLQILDEYSLKNHYNTLQYENKNGYKEELLSEIYFSDSDFDSYFSIFKTDKNTAKKLKGLNIENDFQKYLTFSRQRF